MERCPRFVRNILMKESYDFDRPDVTLHNFHPQFRAVLAVDGLFFNNRDSCLRYVWPAICIILTLVGISMQSMFIWHGITVQDYSFATECFCYWVVLGCVPCVYFSIFFNKQKIYDNMENMDKDFNYICSLGPKYRKKFLQGQLIIWQLTVMWLTWIYFVGFLYILLPVTALCYQSLFATQDEHMIRPLQFPMWLPHDDPYRSPNYELFLFFQSLLTICFIQTFNVYIYTLFHILIHYYIIMDMVILDFDVIFDGLDTSVVCLSRYDKRRMETQLTLNARIGRIVTWHLSVIRAVNNVSSIYGLTLMYQVSFSSIALCLIAYQISDKMEKGTVDVMFYFLGTVTTLQLWIPCYLGTILRNKAFALGEAGWTCGWHETPLGLMIRTDLIIFIRRAQEPITIKFTGLPAIQLETFSNVMTTSYSYFNMLRQYSK